MTPETLTIDRTFKGVGRIKKQTGTTIPAVRRKMNRMLTALAEGPRLDVLRAIRDGEITLIHALDAYQRNELDKLPLGKTSKPLELAMTEWLDDLVIPTDISKGHKSSYKSSIKHFARARKNAPISEIAELLEALRKTLGSKHPRAFNYARSAALAFIRGTLRKNHPLWLACAAVEPRKVPETKRRKPFTLQELHEFFPKAQTDPFDAIAWAMALTGMHADEYFERKWVVKTDRIEVKGTKRAGRERLVPLVIRPPEPAMHRRTWEDRFRVRFAKARTPYDLRRSYANLMEDAMIPRTRRKLYMGHGPGDTTDLYERREVTANLAKDRERLLIMLGMDITPMQLTLKLEK